MTALAGTAIVLLTGLTLYLARRISRRQKRAPRLREEAVKPSERLPEPGDLTAIGRLLHDANERAGAVEMRLQPLVLDIAAGRLRARGIDIDRDLAPMGESSRPGTRGGRTAAAGRGARGAMTLEHSASAADVAQSTGRILDELERAVVGKRDALELVLLGVLADGHVLIEDYPGLAKTLIARSLAEVTEARFARIQFTPDLLPSDVTGSAIFDPERRELRFREGPIFTNVLLADEVNRAPPKTQSALLEAMQERQVTVEEETRPLERPFLVLATQNPIEFEGTYPLPEAQLDRFLLRMRVGYPEREDEWGILESRIDRRDDQVSLDAVVTREELLAMQGSLETIHVDRTLGLYAVDLVRATRGDPRVEVGASPRGTLALLKLSRARAALAGRDFVTPEDVKQIAVPALAHRLVLRPEQWVQRLTGEDVVRDCLEQVAAPPTQPAADEAAG
jgi:MoxR-like ATPase